MTAKRVVVAGGSGLIGSALVAALRERGDTVVMLSRRPGSHTNPVWNPGTCDLDHAILSTADAVVCLSGAGIGDGRWSEHRKNLLVSSRVDAVRCIAETMAAMDDPPAVLASASATGIYGDAGDAIVDESSPPGSDFLAELCQKWEAAAEPAIAAGIRVVHPRTGIVLAPNGGALAPLLPLFRLGLGGPIGSGSQWWSWISIADEVAALIYLLDSDISGPVNLVAPHPVRQKDFAKALGAQLRRPAVMPAPRMAVNARLGRELAQAIGFASQRISPAVLLDSGFTYLSPTVDEALADVFA